MESKVKDNFVEDFIKKLIGFSFGPIISAFIGFLMVPITTWFVSPSELGKSSMYTLAYTVFSLIIYLGMDQAFVREFNAKEDKKVLFWSSVLIPFSFSVLVMIVCAVFSKQISNMLFNSYEFFIMLSLIISLPISVLDRFNLLILRMQEKARTYSFMNIFNKVSNLTVLVINLVFIDRSFRGIVTATFIALILNVLLGSYLNRRFWLSKIQVSKDYIIILLKFALPLIPASLISWIFSYMDKIAMRTWSDFTQIGLYSAALKITTILTIAQQAFSTFWAPTSYRWYETGVENKRFDKVSKMLTSVMSLLFIFVVLFKDLIFKVFADEYSEAAVIVPFLLFIPVMYTISETTTIGISFKRKTSYNILISLLSAVANFIGNYILVPRYGALGAAISTAFAYIIFFWLRTIIARMLWYKFQLRLYIANTMNIVAMSVVVVFTNNVLVWSVFLITGIMINLNNIKVILALIKRYIFKESMEAKK